LRRIDNALPGSYLPMHELLLLRKCPALPAVIGTVGCTSSTRKSGLVYVLMSKE
jgi:hypothetical protein